MPIHLVMPCGNALTKEMIVTPRLNPFAAAPAPMKSWLDWSTGALVADGGEDAQVNRTTRMLYAEALDALLEGRIAEIAVARDWELLREVARLAQQDAPLELASTDPSLYETWRAAVTKYHLKGWTHMTPERVDAVRQRVVDRRRASSLA
jgi:hypothetical protein